MLMTRKMLLPKEKKGRAKKQRKAQMQLSWPKSRLNRRRKKQSVLN
jgi:hypothetical protein